MLDRFFDFSTITKIKLKCDVPYFSVFNRNSSRWKQRDTMWKQIICREGLYKNSHKLKCFRIGECKTEIAQQIRKQEFISIFNPFLCQVIYSWFCPQNGSILDPFCGAATRGIVASILNYKYTGFDIDSEVININNNFFDKFIKKKFAKKLSRPIWVCGDSKDINKFTEDKFDFIFSCPPYWNLERYTEMRGDLSTMSYNKFCKRLSLIIEKTVSLLKKDRFACFVVSELRNLQTGGYLGFVPFIIRSFESAGMIFYNDIILIDKIGTAPVRGSAYFKTKKIARVHQNVLIFYKGNVKKIKQNFKEIKKEENDSNLIKYFNGI